MKKIGVIVLLVAIGLCGCQDSSDVYFIKKSTDFPEVVAINPQILEFPSIMAIRDWTISGQSLICKSRHTNYFFYEFNLSDLAPKDSFCMTGQGPEEFLFPELLVTKDKGCFIIDNAKREGFFYTNGKFEKVVSFNSRDIMSSLHEYDYPLIGYKSDVPNELTWKLVNIEAGATLDSVLYVDEDRKGEALMKFDFEWTFEGNRLYMASRIEDKVTVYPIENGKLMEECVWKGNETSSSKYTYTAIDCTKDYVYLLSSKKEQSEVEVYSKKGEPVCLFKLGIHVIDMLVDEEFGRLLFLTTDQELAFVELSPQKNG